MPQSPSRRRHAGLLVALALLTGCSSNPVSTAPPTIAVAEPAVSPATAEPPAGRVLPLNRPATAAVFDAATKQLAVLCPGADVTAPAGLALLSPTGRPAPPVPLPGPAAALTGDGAGTAYLATRGGYFTVDLAHRHAERVEVAGTPDVEFTAIARRDDGTLLLGSADGAVYTLARDTAAPVKVAARADIFARVDAIAVHGDTAVVLDRGQTSVTTVGADGKPQYSLRAGQGATTLAADPRGPVLAVDTRGGQLLVYGTDPLLLRQAYPVPDTPYGLVGSTGLVWVSQTAANTVVGYDISTGIPVEKIRYPSVRQPNTLAFDDASGTLFVVSGVGAGVQVVEHAAGHR